MQYYKANEWHELSKEINDYYSPFQCLYSYKGLSSAQFKNMFILIDERGFLLGQHHNTKFGAIASWNGGPVVEKREYQSDFLKEACNYLNRLGYIGIDNTTPSYYSGDDFQQAYLEAGFTQKSKWATFVLNLHNDIEAIYATLQKGLKKNVRKMQETNYSLKEICHEAVLNDYVMVMNEARIRSGLSKLTDLGEILLNLRGNPWRKYFVLYVDNIPVACQGIIYNKRVAIEVVLGVATFALENKMYAGDLLKWEILKWCQEKGIEKYDFAGVAPKFQDEKEKGIFLYKQKWGGDYIEYSIWKKALSPRFYLYESLTKLKRWLKR